MTLEDALLQITSVQLLCLKLRYLGFDLLQEKYYIFNFFLFDIIKFSL